MTKHHCFDVCWNMRVVLDCLNLSWRFWVNTLIRVNLYIVIFIATSRYGNKTGNKDDGISRKRSSSHSKRFLVGYFSPAKCRSGYVRHSDIRRGHCLTELDNLLGYPARHRGDRGIYSYTSSVRHGQLPSHGHQRRPCCSFRCVGSEGRYRSHCKLRHSNFDLRSRSHD